MTGRLSERRRGPSTDPRIGIEYLGQYGGNRWVRERIRSYGNRTGEVVDYDNLRLMREAGFKLVTERDNKSVWSPKDILAPLLKFGNGIPPGLVERVCALEHGQACTACSSGRQLSSHDVADCTVFKIAQEFKSGNGRGMTTEAFDEGSFCWAVNSVMRMVGGKGDRDPWTIDQAIDHQLGENKDSYAGIPYFCRNDEVDRDRLVRDCLATVNGKALPPFVVTKRVQHGDGAPKGRLVWAAGLVTSVLATMYSKPIYEAIKDKWCFSYGDYARDTGAKLVSLHSKRDYVYGLDFSAFDASISARIIDAAFGILTSHLRLSSGQKQLLDRIISDFIHSRLVLPDGSLWQVHRGVPSGSAFTSLVDSVANLIILQYVWIRRTRHSLGAREVVVLGDDSAVASDWYLDLTQIQETAQELGMVLSASKSARVRLGGMVPYLGHLWKAGVAHRDEWDIAIRLAYPEKWNRHLRDPRFSLLRRVSMTADCVEAYQLFFRVMRGKRSRSVEQCILNEVYTIDLPSLYPELSSKEKRSALTGRQEYLRRVENTSFKHVNVWSTFFVHSSRWK